jgi:hypothetical protein
MRRNSNLEKHGRVLSYLAVNGPAIKYRMEKDLQNQKKSIDHATLHKISTELKRTFLIAVVKEERSRVGLKIEYYDLTPMGLIAAIEYDTQRGNRALDMDELAKKYPSHLPLIFGKWQFFNKSGWNPEKWLRASVTDRIEPWNEWTSRILKVPELGQIYEMYLQDERRLSKWIHPHITELYENFFLIDVSDEVQSKRERRTRVRIKKLDQIWASDPDIGEWILSELTSKEKEWLAEARRFERRRRQLEAMKLRMQQQKDRDFKAK